MLSTLSLPGFSDHGPLTIFLCYLNLCLTLSCGFVLLALKELKDYYVSDHHSHFSKEDTITRPGNT